MTTYLNRLFLFCTLIIGLGSMLAGRTMAQTLTTVHQFSATSGSPQTNSDGGNPYAGLILSGNTLYGTSLVGGGGGNGTVFGLNVDGTGFTNLHSFTFAPGFVNNDGQTPYAGLLLSSNTLYGTAQRGGTFYPGYGTVFSLDINTGSLTNLHNFTTISGAAPSTNSDGAQPTSSLTLVGDTLYGTAPLGGTSGNGTVFKVATDGTGFTTLYHFTTTVKDPSTGNKTNSDGVTPNGGLVVSGNTLYGVTSLGGAIGGGTLFAINMDGTGFTNLHNFTGGEDGFGPEGNLALSGNTLYGAALHGGTGGAGTLFAVNTDGTGFRTVYTFTHPLVVGGAVTNADGVNPYGGLLLSGSTLYGTGNIGGVFGKGTVFAVHTDGSGFTTLYQFTTTSGTFFTNSNGANPFGGLVLLSNTVYGTTKNGGSFGKGTVFSLPLPPPQLTITLSGENMVLKWPVAAGFILQSCTNPFAPAVWTTNSPEPIVFNGQNTVTNPISNQMTFYRLSH